MSSNHSISTIDVLVIFKKENETFSKHLSMDDTVNKVFEYICENWKDLTPSCFDLSYERDGKIRMIETNSDLHGILLLNTHNKEDYLTIFVNTKKTYSASSAVGCSNLDRSNSSESWSISSSSTDQVNNSEFFLKNLLKTDPSNPFIIEVGQMFPGGVNEFRLFLMVYSIKTGYRLKLIKNDNERVTAICSREGCLFRVHASPKFKLPGYFIIKTLQPIHSCGAGILDVNHPPVSSLLVKKVVFDYLRSNPLMKTKDIVRLFQKEYNVVLNYYFAYTGKKLALEEIHGNDLLSYHYLKLFCEKVVECNPGSLVSLEKDEESNQFERVFLAYEACIHGFAFCRALIFLDGTFMKGRGQGCIMSATAKNGNQGLYPIALGVVSGEDENNWLWFLSKLKECLRDDYRTITFISDRHPGLLLAVPKIFPNSHHGSCYYHLKNNLKSFLTSKCPKGMKSWIVQLFFKVANAATLPDFEDALTNFKNVGGAPVHNFLKDLPFDKFANVFFNGNRYGELSSNCAESFNSWILEERSLPITACLDKIRIKLMKLMSDRRELSQSWNSILCPVMEERLKTLQVEGMQWRATRSDDDVYEVHADITYSINLMHKRCTCNVWRIQGFPCAHAVRCALAFDKNVYDYVEEYFKVSYFQASYSHAINPLLNFEMKKVALDDIEVEPPMQRRRAGRPSLCQRIKSAGEISLYKKCGICKKLGHNKRTCEFRKGN